MPPNWKPPQRRASGRISVRLLHRNANDPSLHHAERAPRSPIGPVVVLRRGIGPLDDVSAKPRRDLAVMRVTAQEIDPRGAKRQSDRRGVEGYGGAGDNEYGRAGVSIEL